VRCIPKLWVANGKEAQINRSQGLDGESEDLRPGRPRSITQNLGVLPLTQGREEIQIAAVGCTRPLYGLCDARM